MRLDGKDLKDFQFTPGSNFMDYSVYDIVNELLEVNRRVESGESKPLDFNDLRQKDAI